VWYERGGKRLLDVAGAAALLLLTAPLLLAAMLAVRLAMGRPVLFRQIRAGRGGAPFTLLKLRSMRDGAGDDAARLTPLGRLLRASAIDELPQLLNVLRGEMSLVGPRPLPVEYVALYSAREAMRLRARPGLCGLAQAAGRNAVPWALRLRLDVDYVRRVSLRRDLRIMLGCAAVLLRGRGVAAAGHATMPRFLGAGQRRP
jgi:lipopolysaccharide/colanic/teichoic acid biosynthesis glycosyltransferase